MRAGAGAGCCLWWGGGEDGEGAAPSFAGSGRQAEGGPSDGVGLAGVERGEDALVADGEQAGQLSVQLVRCGRGGVAMRLRRPDAVIRTVGGLLGR